MFVHKSFPLRSIISFTKSQTLVFSAWTVFAVCIIEALHYFQITGFRMPWLPVSIIGTAVAFYVGFKNNSAYDRLWEARKIWGAIVNSSRMWSTTIINFATTHFADEDVTEEEVKSWHKRLIYRHIAWLYSLRSQLLIPTPWEHINQGKRLQKRTEEGFKTWGVGLFDDEVTKVELNCYLRDDERDALINAKNTCTQIINAQSEDLHRLRQKGIIEDFRHMELQNVLNEFYTHQGKCERIKKFPLPRQYGNSSQIFLWEYSCSCCHLLWLLNFMI